LKVIQVKNVPEEVHRALRTRAAAADIPLNQLVLEELTRIAARPPVEEVLRRAQRRPAGASMETIVVAVRTRRKTA
jgi:plasmid stability protein